MLVSATVSNSPVLDLKDISSDVQTVLLWVLAITNVSSSCMRFKMWMKGLKTHYDSLSVFGHCKSDKLFLTPKILTKCSWIASEYSISYPKFIWIKKTKRLVHFGFENIHCELFMALIYLTFQSCLDLTIQVALLVVAAVRYVLLSVGHS